jgi:hypothetical protein
MHTSNTKNHLLAHQEESFVPDAMISIDEFNKSSGLPKQDPREVVYNSAFNRTNELHPFKFPPNYPTFQWGHEFRRLEDLTEDMRSYPLNLYLENYETEPELANHRVVKASINTKRITIAITSHEPNLRGLRVIVKRHIFFHTEKPCHSLDEITETGEAFNNNPLRNKQISVLVNSTEEQPWIYNAFKCGHHQIQSDNNETAAITSTDSSSESTESYEPHLAQTLEMSDDE